jgi:hypothetical protein
LQTEIKIELGLEKRKSNKETKSNASKKTTSPKKARSKKSSQIKKSKPLVEEIIASNDITLSSDFNIPSIPMKSLKTEGLQQFLIKSTNFKETLISDTTMAAEYDEMGEYEGINPDPNLNSQFNKNLISNIMNSFIEGIMISRQGGDILYSKQIQGNLNFNLISNFLAALNIFGEENIGKINRILIEGLNVELNVVQKHDLIFTTVFIPNKVKDHFNKEGHQALDMFYEKYKSALEKNRADQMIYKSFDTNITELIKSYLKRVGDKKE